MDAQYGKVYLAGAGPGHEKLITVRGMEVLQKADCIVYDRLVNPELLRYAKEHAELIFCGKSPQDHTMDQEAINALLVAKAKAGKRVIRLKGGDPSIFGRVGEEAGYCREHGVGFEIIPGVTSGIAAAAYAGIPLTHRELNSSVAFITGHRKAGEPEEGMDLEMLATSAETLVFYMGVKNLPRIRDALIAQGRPAHTPVAVIRWGTLASQQTIVTTIGEMADPQVMRQIKPPSIIVVGEVVSLRQELQWFEHQPLAGVRLFFPVLSGWSRRGANQSAHGELLRLKRLTDRLGDMGADVNVVEFAPCIREDAAIKQLLIERLPSCEAICFDDPWNAEVFFQYLQQEQIDIRSIRAKFVAADDAAAEQLAARGIVSRHRDIADQPVTDRILRFGISAPHNLARFEQIWQGGAYEKKSLAYTEHDRIVLTDARQVHVLADWLRKLPDVGLLSLSPQVTAAARLHGLITEESSWLQEGQADTVSRDVRIGMNR